MQHRSLLRPSSASVALTLALGVAFAAISACSDDPLAVSDDTSSGHGTRPGPDQQGSIDGGPDAPGTPGNPNNPGTDGGDAAGDSGPLPIPEGELFPEYVNYDINHVLSTGQSNSVANGGTPVASTTQPFTNVMFDTGVMPMKSCDGSGCTQYDAPSSFLPLVEGDRFFSYQVETASAGIANGISNIAAQKFKFGTRMGYPSKHDVLVSLHGRSGNTYWCLRKGGCTYKPGNQLRPFAQGMMEVQSAKDLATAAGKTYAVRAVTAIHGESDHYSYTAGSQEFPLGGSDGTPNALADYGDALVEWQRDYEAGVKAITGQAQPVPLLISQLSGWTDTQVSRVAQMQLEAHVKAPGKVILVVPGYAIESANDCLHYTAQGQRRLGEYFAKAYTQMIFSNRAWEPLRPAQISLAGNVITVKYVVPKPPIVIDTARVKQIANYGFTYTDDSGTPPAITAVAVTGPDTVAITLAAAPTGGSKRLRYAQNQGSDGSCIGPGLTNSGGARGNLRDSDDTPSNYGYDLSNWGVQFDQALP